jgi:cytochrome subunit of sulfide dehydrogenase
MRITRFVVATALAGLPLAAFSQGIFPNTGRDLAASCAICHGTSGINAGGMPNLAGQPKDYLVRQLRDFRDGKRPATVMHQVSKGLTEEQIELVAVYWSAQKVK